MANEIQTTQNNANLVPGFSSMASFDLLQRISKMFNSSSLMPAQYRGPENFGNCVIAVNMAQRMNADVMMVAQNLYVVHGNPAWSSKFMIATFNQCGKYSSIHYKETGEKNTDSWGCIAWAKELATGEILEGPEITIGIAKKEGWYGKSGSKWQTMPQQMLRYRAASWFIRTTAPEISMGLQSVDEVIDAEPINVTNEINANANREEFIPEAPAPAIEPAKKVTIDDLNKVEAEVAAPAPKPVPAKKPSGKKKEAEPQQAALEGPGF